MNKRRKPKIATIIKYSIVTLSGSDAVSVIDVESFKEVEKIKVGEIPHGIEIKALPGIGGSC